MCSTKSGLLITLRGYHHKQPILLEKIIDLLLTFDVDEARFPALKDAYQRRLKNFAAEQPQQHTAYHTSLLLSENMWEKAELLEKVQIMRDWLKSQRALTHEWLEDAAKSAATGPWHSGGW